MTQVQFQAARDGGVMARYEGKVAFPERRGPQPQAGETWECEKAGENASGRVVFLRCVRQVVPEIPVFAIKYSIFSGNVMGKSLGVSHPSEAASAVVYISHLNRALPEGTIEMAIPVSEFPTVMVPATVTVARGAMREYYLYGQLLPQAAAIIDAAMRAKYGLSASEFDAVATRKAAAVGFSAFDLNIDYMRFQALVNDGVISPSAEGLEAWMDVAAIEVRARSLANVVPEFDGDVPSVHTELWRFGGYHFRCKAGTPVAEIATFATQWLHAKNLGMPSGMPEKGGYDREQPFFSE